MKRSAALAPLSRDHQHALSAALRLRRADADTVEEALSRFRAFFEREGRRHFAIEEEHLLDALPPDHGAWDDAVARVREDHAAIRTAADTRAAESADPEARLAAARRLGERLHAHVRFEENVLFVILEERLTAKQLDGLAVAVAAAERSSEGPDDGGPRVRD